MGGYGSGKRYDKKTTVEECRTLDAGKLARDRLVYPALHAYGSLVWRVVETGEKVSEIGYEVDTTERNREWLRLHYQITRTGENLDYKVRLVKTYPHFGGVRWWFICPLTVNGRPCLRRVGKLYLPPGGRYFGCRHCHDLTYTSAQEHDKRVALLQDMDPEDLLKAVDSGDVGLLLALKAMGY